MTQTMRAWQYTSVSGGIEKNLKINDAAPRPEPKADEIQVQIHTAALNPVDYKITESPAPLRLLGRVFIPGSDFSGKISKIGTGVSNSEFKVGDLVFGSKNGEAVNGTLAQYITVGKHQAAKLPPSVRYEDAATLGIVGLTELQSIKPYVKSGDRIFINGGSGGTGSYGVQIAKALGLHVTTSCSTPNVQLCKDLGADEVIDYKTTDVVKELTSKGKIFKLIVDNVGTPANLYKASNAYIAPGGTFVQVGMTPSLGSLLQVGSNFARPGFLGGGKAKYQMLMAQPNKSMLEELGGFLRDGKMKSVIDSEFKWEDVPRAYEKLKTGRVKGKIIVSVPQEGA